MLELGAANLLLLIITILISLYFYWIRQIREVAQKGLKFITPKPFFGNNFQASLNFKHFNDVVKEVYHKFPNERYVAFFNFQKTNIMIRDPQILSQISMKSLDHYIFMDEQNDPLFFYGLFQLKGDRWKDMRSSLTPAFTSSKMKEMLPFIKECSNSLISYLNTRIDKEHEICDIEAKTLMMKCANDVIASCAFGLLTNSFNEPENEFFKMALQLTQIKPKDFIRFLPVMICPKLSKLFGIHLMKVEQTKYYRRIVKDIIEYRENSGTVRRDMIHLLMLAKRGILHNDKNSNDTKECKDLTNFYEQDKTKQNWKDDEITAQALIFLFAGFESTSTLMSFALYELAVNSDCQKKLHDEIDEYIETNGRDIDFTHINKMEYLDMIVSETLRLWPPVSNTDRLCNEDFYLPPTGSNTKELKINSGDIFMIPIYCLHRDAKYWNDPLKFDPERFSKENKCKITPNTYLPFGAGQRSCIGTKFVQMECKMFLFYILSNFSLVTTSKTEVPLTIKNHLFFITAKNGLWIGLKKRSTKT